MLLTDPSRMDRDRDKVAAKLLNLTLEILFQLTRGDYTARKKNSSDSCKSPVSEGWGRNLSSIMGSSSHPLIHEDINVQKILELTNKMIELLTGEVPIRCQDVTVYFSMEEWDYMEEHKDLYKDILTENHQPLTSPVKASKRKKTKRCPPPLLPRNYSEENHNVPQEDNLQLLFPDKDLNIIYAEEINMSDDQQFKEEIPTDDYPDDCMVSSEEHLISADCKADDCGITQDTYEEPAIIPDISSAHHSKDPSSDLHIQVPSSDSSLTDKQNKSSEERLISSGFKTNDPNITQDTSEEHAIILDLPSALQNKDASSDPLKQVPSSDSSQIDEQNKSLEEHVISSGFKVDDPNITQDASEERVIIYHLSSYPLIQVLSYDLSQTDEQNKSHRRREQQGAHTEEKPYSCSECERCFSRKSDLVNHQRTHTVKKTYSCSECGKCFPFKSYLVTHQRTHTGEKPFSCSECKKCFSMQSSLDVHQRTHTGERPFLCPECGKCFIKNSHLVRHLETHKREMPQSCAECGKCFNQWRSLKAHQTNAHPGEK
ncbi:gastrula zinc finger protein XlCGF66.1-like isoform X1 [Eleutherodactylus coqui]|uniref:gastrula zinc finger protein XlCGF66.1-like isoform X1 n=1 Tax=Eleutherodactylus coqui TaxID=57060 RepID=UPI00346214A6